MKDKILLITGGTGSFGTEAVRQLLNTDIKEIRVFSRDEKKQEDMALFYNSPKLKFFIGDVRDYNSITPAMTGVDYVFHAAAMKQLPSCENFPEEAIKTNVLGTENVINKAIECGVKKVICLSTDKAVAPNSTLGLTKALMEKIAVKKSKEQNKTTIVRTRFGNIIGSRNSVIPKWEKAEILEITNPSMTRFMMSINDAIKIVMFAFEHGEQGDLFVLKSPSCTLETLASSFYKPVKIIGNRGCEKIHEVLISEEEMMNAVDNGEFYTINNKVNGVLRGEYASNNTKLLTIEEARELHD